MGLDFNGLITKGKVAFAPRFLSTQSAMSPIPLSLGCWARLGVDGATCHIIYSVRGCNIISYYILLYLGLCIDTDIRRYIDRYDIIYLSAEGFADTSIYIGGDI